MQALITGKASNVEQAIEQAIIDAKERWILA
jgi:ribosomal protein S5